MYSPNRSSARNMQGTLSGVDSALSSAGDTLRRVDAQVLIGQRDIASINVEAQRALATRDAKLAEADIKLREQNNNAIELENSSEQVNVQLAGSRRRLADLQVSVDTVTQHVQQGHATLAELVRRVEATSSSFDTLVNTEKNERRDVENRISQAEQNSRRLQDEIKVAISMRGPAATAHSDRTGDTRRRLEAIRRDIENKKSELDSVCTALDDQAKQQDEAQRRFAKSQEEKVAQFITERRASTQKLNSERQEKERAIRAQTESQADELRAKATTLSDSISQFKEVENRGLAREMELHDAIALSKEKLVGKNALEARLATAENGVVQTQMELRALEEDCQSSRDKTAALSNQITSYENTLAPLPDIENSTRQIGNQAQARQQEIADRTADHALWVAKHQEQLGLAKRALENSMGQIEEQKRRRDQTSNDTNLEKNTLTDQQRILGEQLRNVDLELQEINQRNQLADRRIDVARQEHEKEQAELRHRKDTARQAAAHLLASLTE